jgi:hypothetical protein
VLEECASLKPIAETILVIGDVLVRSEGVVLLEVWDDVVRTSAFVGFTTGWCGMLGKLRKCN